MKKKEDWVKLRLDGEQYREFSETANCLFDAQKLDVDCRFSFFSVQFSAERIAGYKIQ